MSLDSMNDGYFVRKVNKRVSVVPWYNVDQFIKVYDCAFSNEIVRKRWAYDTMSVWDTRCYPSLPAAIECTYILLGAVIQDILWNSQKSIINHGDVQCMYGSAVTRFVSLMTETHKELPNESTAEIVKRLGIPPFIAHIRNEWCHSSRPSLAMLRLASEEALKYLKETYWLKQVNKIRNHIKEPQDCLQIKRLLFDYMHAQILRLSDETDNDEEEAELQKLCGQMILKLKESVKKDRRKFISALLSDGFFIPYDDELKLLISYQEAKIWNSDEDDDNTEDDAADDGSGAVSAKEPYLPSIPAAHEQVWAPVIAILNVHDAVPLFMESLLKSQHNRSPDGQKLLIAWVSKILRIHCSQVERCLLKDVFRRRPMIPNWHSMFYSALLKPCKYTMCVLPLIVIRLDLEHDVSLRVISLLAIYLGQFKGSHFPGHDRVYTFDEFKATDVRQREELVKQFRKKISEVGVWRPCIDDEFMNWPAGCVINIEKEEEEQEEEEEEEEEMESEENIQNSVLESKSQKLNVLGNENDLTKDCEMDVDSQKLSRLPDVEEIRNAWSKRKNILYNK